MKHYIHSTSNYTNCLRFQLLMKTSQNARPVLSHWHGDEKPEIKSLICRGIEA